MADSSAHGAPECPITHLRAVLAVATAVLLWGMSSVAIKSVAPSGVVTAFYRLWFASPSCG